MTDPAGATAAVAAAEQSAALGSEQRAGSLWSAAFRDLRRRPSVIIAAFVALFFSVVAAAPRLFTQKDPRLCNISQTKIAPQGFGAEYPFGTNDKGCDLYAQLIYGTRPSLLLALLVVTASVVIGVVLGLLAGFYGGWVDGIISRTIEVFLVIPLLLAALLLLSMFRNVSFGDNSFAIVLQPALVLTLFAWMSYARYVRASVLESKNLEYVTAAKVLGASNFRLMVRHVLPNAVGTVTALVPTAIAGVIGAEAVLAFLGIGVKEPAVSWGILIRDGSNWFSGNTHYMLLFPLVCLLITVMAFVVIGDALRDALDPKLR